jgi:hypothetical protein
MRPDIPLARFSALRNSPMIHSVTLDASAASGRASFFGGIVRLPMRS